MITGGTRGIGRGIAEAFAAQGAAVVLGGRSAEKGEQAVEEMGIGDRAMFVPCDVRRREDVENLIDQAAKRYGSADIMVNNAGGSDRFALVHEMTDEAWQNALDFNLNAVFWGSRRALRYMLERGWGRIINISSVEGKQGEQARGQPLHHQQARHKRPHQGRGVPSTGPRASPATRSAPAPSRRTR